MSCDQRVVNYFFQIPENALVFVAESRPHTTVNVKKYTVK